MGIPPLRQTAVAVLISTLRLPPPYQPGTMMRSQCVFGSVSTLEKLARRLPVVRERSFVPGRRGGLDRRGLCRGAGE